MGFSSGFCLKRMSGLVAFGVGSIFIILQTLSYNGYINVDYDRIQKDVEVFCVIMCACSFISMFQYNFSMFLHRTITEVSRCE
jgi:uncharacterized membrane protein (Fun14 family)